MTKSRNKSGILRWVQAILLLAGIAGIGAWAASIAAPAIWQSWENWAFDLAADGKTATVTAYVREMEHTIVRDVAELFGSHPAPEPSHSESDGAISQDSQAESSEAPQESPPENREGVSPPAIPPNALVGRLAIPRLHMTTIVREGTGDGTLLLAAGHIPGTSLPGTGGNVGVAAHRDTLFRALAKIRRNDLIRFETIGASYRYKVTSTEVVRPQEVGVLKAGRDPELTLVTCYPFNYIGSAPDRFIVKARLMASVPRHLPLEDAREPDAATPATDLSPPRGVTRPTVGFRIGAGHSQQLAPGISLGVTRADVDDHQVDGWMWIMPERRTIWLRHQSLQQPLIFYQDGKRRELTLTSLTGSGVTGYMLLRAE